MIGASGLRAAVRALALALPVLLAAVLPARGQTVFVTAGEHAGFTRIVLQSATGFAWSLAEDGADLRVALPGRTLRVNPDTVFSRIPRTRLSALRIEGEALVLTRPCLCPARSFEDRPGVLVIDLQDGGPLPEPATAAAPAPAPQDPAWEPVDPGRAAGLALARRLSADRDGGAQAPPDHQAEAARSLDLSRTIPAEIAAAMTRGLLPAPAPAQAPRLLGAPVELSGLPALPPNLALRNADAPLPAPVPDAAGSRQQSCPAESVFAALAEPARGSFNTELTAVRSALYGEFDQPDAANWLALATHYLRWGLGAEARQILDLEGLGIENREILGGLADLVEGLASNRRARMARHIGCPGPVALFAWLATPPDQPAPDDPGPIVAVFQTLTPDLREALGTPLVRRLIAGGQIEAARIVAETAGRTPNAEGGAQAILDALLDQARGEFGRAAARLETVPGTDLVALQLRLDLALTQGNALPEAQLLDAETLAEAVRTTDIGRAVGELVVRHHALAGRLNAGFALLDRFSQWGAPGPDHRRRVAALRSALWFASAGQDDATFLVAALGRGDWRDPELDETARAAVAARFEGLGLPQLAADVGRPLPPGANPEANPDSGGPAAPELPVASTRPPPPDFGARNGPAGPPAPSAAPDAPEAPANLPPAPLATALQPATPPPLALPTVLAELVGAGVAAPRTGAPEGRSDEATAAAPRAADAPPEALSVAPPSAAQPEADPVPTLAAPPDLAAAGTLPPAGPASGRDPMVLGVQRLEESQALRAALVELGLTRR